MVSDWSTNCVLCQWNDFENKVQKTKKKNTKKKVEKILRNESKTNIMDILSHFLHYQRPHFQNSFSFILIFVFCSKLYIF